MELLERIKENPCKEFRSRGWRLARSQTLAAVPSQDRCWIFRKLTLIEHHHYLLIVFDPTLVDICAVVCVFLFSVTRVVSSYVRKSVGFSHVFWPALSAVFCT